MNFALAGVKGLVEFGMPMDEPIDPMMDYKDARYNRIGNWLTPGLHAVYTYDYGDDWIHDVYVEEALPQVEGAPKAVCLDGANNCPPEDVGGLHGFYETLAILADKQHEDYEETKTWVESITGQSPYKADWFNVTTANRRMGKAR